MRIRTVGSVVFSCVLVFAQSERGNITGVVTDSTGAVVPNVPVVITNQATNIPENVTTTSSGEYSAPNLTPGAYRIVISATGFKRFVEDGVILTDGTWVHWPPHLEDRFSNSLKLRE